MFDFFDNQKNPLMFMMNMMNAESMGEDTIPEQALDPELAEMMKEAFGMQMQMMRMMCAMQMQFMQGFAGMMGMDTGMFDAFRAEAGASAGQQGGFKLGNMEIPPQMIAKLMQMDMSPENLEKLQRGLDFLFEILPETKDE